MSFWEAILGRRFVCCALIALYSIHSMVGRSIASISDLSGIFTSGLIYVSAIDLLTIPAIYFT